MSFVWAVAACVCVLAWQFLTVHYNRQDNWTALFYTGQVRPVPPELQAGTYMFPGRGYDGQMYRYIAHDPFLRNGWERYIDSPTFRYRRILVPALAFMLAGGRQQWIDAAYVAVTSLFVLLGSFWLSRWAVLHGFHAAWALAFPLVPAALISMDRMTMDGALAALSVGFVYFIATGNTAKLFALLLAACLVRETGTLLVAGCILFDLSQRRFARAAVWATACLPMLVWYGYVYWNLHGDPNIFGMPNFLEGRLGLGIIGAILHPPHYALGAAIESITRSLDVVSLLGMLCALVAGLLLLRTRPLNPISIAAVLFAAMAIMLTSSIYWRDSFGYTRAFSPLLILIALQAAGAKNRMRAWWWMLLPAPLMDLRIGLQLGPQVLGVFRGLLGH